MRFDKPRLLRLLLAGAFAGFVIFLVFNKAAAEDEEKLTRILTGKIMDIDAAMQWLKDVQKHFTTPDPLGALTFTGGFAAMVGGVVVIMDEMFTTTKRVIKRALLATVYGWVIGGAIGVTIDLVSTRMARVSLLLFPIAQILLFPLIGFSAGAAVGLILGSWKRMRLAMIGGLLGGFLGGMAFQAIGSMTSLVVGSGSIGRLFGFMAMGAVIGASVAFVEEMGKQSWVTVLNGAKEGRQYILSKPTTTIGRDERADFPLFGDTSVAKDHANLALAGYLVKLNSVGGEVEINGRTVQSAQLQPLDIIRIGRHLLRFHQRWERSATYAAYQAQYPQRPYVPPAPPPAPPPTQAPQTQAGYVPAQTMLQPTVATGNLALVVSSGPHANLRFEFPPGTIRIGRELDHEVLLALDALVSRSHAEITWCGTSWVVRDLNSRHGLWINGVRVAEHVLNVGDQVGVGQTWLRVEGI